MYHLLQGVRSPESRAALFRKKQHQSAQRKPERQDRDIIMTDNTRARVLREASYVITDCVTTSPFLSFCAPYSVEFRCGGKLEERRR